MKKKNNVENNKFGKNDNMDFGSNKNNKIKEVVKNSEINNINYNPNDVIVNLVEKIALKERRVQERVQIFKKCENCKIEVDKNINSIDSIIQKINTNYSLEKQLSNPNGVLLDTSNFINELNYKKELIYDFWICDACCQNHKELFNENELDRVEIKSLNKSLGVLSKK